MDAVCELLHAKMQQRARIKHLESFSCTDNSVLIATDVAARGLDIKGIENVIHYQIPRSVENYVHRSGRLLSRKLCHNLHKAMYKLVEGYEDENALFDFEDHEKLNDIQKEINAELRAELAETYPEVLAAYDPKLDPLSFIPDFINTKSFGCKIIVDDNGAVLDMTDVGEQPLDPVSCGLEVPLGSSTVTEKVAAGSTRGDDQEAKYADIKVLLSLHNDSTGESWPQIIELVQY
uniref:ATP-dependent RNA helicase n=1 Tax=Panagrolaimus sp. ES5 TaxID=591445 RepID=A0AC34FYD9_9BILA